MDALCALCGRKMETTDGICGCQTYHEWKDNKIPHKCPVCHGTGKVDRGFYSSDTGAWSSSSMGREMCLSCGGSGIVWGVNDE